MAWGNDTCLRSELTFAFDGELSPLTIALRMLGVPDLWLGGDPCDWEYLHCLPDGSGYEIDLAGRQLSGDFPHLQLQLLHHCRSLDITDNRVHGAITTDVAGIAQLRLRHNRLFGTFPATLCQSSSELTHLDLIGNQFTGVVPDSICDCTNLERLSLDWNRFEGALPLCMQRLDLKSFSATANRFGGGLPAFGNWSRLEYFSVKGNHFYMPPPSPSLSLHALHYLDVSDNDLQMAMPDTLFAAMPSLEFLDLSNNGFYGVFPRVGHLNNLFQLKAANNHFSHLPEVAPSRVSIVDFRHNNISELPYAFLSLQNLSHFMLDGNPLVDWPLPIHCQDFGLINAPQPVYSWPKLIELSVGHTPLGKSVSVGQFFCSLHGAPLLGILKARNASLGGELNASRCPPPGGCPRLKQLFTLDLSQNLIVALGSGYVGHNLGRLDLSNNRYLRSVAADWMSGDTLVDLNNCSDLRIPVELDPDCKTSMDYRGLPLFADPNSFRNPSSFTVGNRSNIFCASRLCNAGPRVLQFDGVLAPALCRCQDGYQDTTDRTDTILDYGQPVLLNCTLCPQDTYSKWSLDLPNGTEVCQACPPHATTNGAVGAVDRSHCLCDIGFIPEMGNCKACPRGKYSDRVGATSCEECPPFTTTLEEGTSDEEACVCKAGSIVPHGSRTFGMCHECESGTYADQPGLTVCSNCSKHRDNWVTMQRTSKDGKLVWTWLPGATSRDACGCDAGSRPDGPYHCVPCTRGMICPGMGEIIIKKGYHAEASRPTEVYECHQLADRCPEGPAGLCAWGRDNNSIACSRCLPDMIARTDGSCEECARGNAVQTVLLLVTLLVCLILLSAMVRRWHAQFRERLQAVSTLSLGLIFSAAQQVAVIAMIQVTWLVPVKMVLNSFALFRIDLDILNLQCMVPFGPLEHHLCKLGLIVLILCFLVCWHMVVSCLAGGRPLRNGHVLINLLGIVLMTFHESILFAIVMPFQCFTHPSGILTVHGYPDVRCWSADGPHLAMVISSSIALLLSVGLLACVVERVLAFPRRMLAGDVKFLARYRFLFFRFRAKAYWYAPAILIRDTLVIVSPVLPKAFLQVICLEVVLTLSLVLMVFVRPWRVGQLSAADTLCHLSLLLLVAFSAFFVEDSDLDVISWLCCLNLLVSFALLIAGVFFAMCHNQLRRQRKPFSHFICHHKAGAGSFARLLKIELGKRSVSKAPARRSRVFIDSDDLQDLDLLFDYVGTQSERLVLLCSEQLFSRPWCIGEIITGYHHDVPRCSVQLPGFRPVDHDFIDNLGELVDLSCLVQHSLTLAMAQDALRWARVAQEVVLPMELSFRMFDELCPMLEQPTPAVSSEGKRLCLEVVKDRLHKNMKVAVLYDYSNFEATSTAMILKDLLMEHTSHMAKMVPQLLPPREKLPGTVRTIIMLCSEGVFMRRDVLVNLQAAAKLQASVLPILSDENFRFPNEAFIDAAWPVASSITDQPNELLALVLEVFKEIAPVFQPQLYSSTEAFLRTRAGEVAARLFKADRRVLSRNASPCAQRMSMSKDGLVAAGVVCSSTPSSSSASPVAVLGTGSLSTTDDHPACKGYRGIPLDTNKSEEDVQQNLSGNVENNSSEPSPFTRFAL